MLTAGRILRLQGEALHEALADFVWAYLAGERGRIRCHDVSVTQCYALDALLRRGPSTLGALSAELCLDKSTASRVVGGLQRKGYVGRAAHPSDGRAVLLGVTSAGRRLHDRIRADRIAEQTQLLADFAPDVREGITDVMRRVADATRVRMGGARTPGGGPPGRTGAVSAGREHNRLRQSTKRTDGRWR
jgi:MarR family transcriptional regulator, 2-MHQ and catechol-resistance regulon repressor